MAPVFFIIFRKGSDTCPNHLKNATSDGIDDIWPKSSLSVDILKPNRPLAACFIHLRLFVINELKRYVHLTVKVVDVCYPKEDNALDPKRSKVNGMNNDE